MEYLFKILLYGVFIKELWSSCFEKVSLKQLPSNHVFVRIRKSNTPLVIGHMGNILQYQENTLEGMQNLINIKADGMHMKIQITKDEELILFGDDNLYRLAGEDYNVVNLPYKEIEKMTLLAEVKYGKDQCLTKEVKRSYKSRVKIPLLRDVLNTVKGNNMLIYIELVPGNVPPSGPFDRHRSETTAKVLAALIKELNLKNEVIIVSKDAFKLKALNVYDSTLVTGWLFDELYFQEKIADKIKYEYSDLPELYQQKCFDTKPNGFTFSKYLLTSGIISKTVNASVADFSYSIIADNKYYKTGTQSFSSILKSTYGDQTTLGAFKIFTIGSAEQTKQEDIAFADSAISNGVTRFITDDVNRMKVALKESVVNYSTGVMLRSCFTAFILILLFAKATVAIIFI